MIEDIRNREKHPNVSLGFELGDIIVERDKADLDLYPGMVEFNLVLTNGGPLKSSDTYIMLKPQDGSFSPPHRAELASRLFGIEQGWYGWALTRPLLPQSEIRVGTKYHVGARYNRHPMSKAWWDATGEVFFGDLAVSWKLFADSAPPKVGEFTFEEIGLHSRLRASAHKQFGTR